MNVSRIAKFMNFFFRGQFPIYGIPSFQCFNKCLLFRVSKQEIVAKLTSKEFSSLEINLQELAIGGAELAECILLLTHSPSILVQFHSGRMCPGVKSYIWECNKVINENVLLIQLPSSFPKLPKLNVEFFSISFEFLQDLTHLAKCHYAIECFKERKLEYLIFPSDQKYYPSTNSFTCQTPLKEWDTKLNPQQESAMEAILLPESVLPVIIAGPFGTGKTFLLSRAAEYLVRCSKECHILICTHTNSAADVYLDYFYKRIPSDHDCKILRLVCKEQMVVKILKYLHKYCLFDSPKHQEFCYPLEPEARKYQIIITTVMSAQQLLKLNLTGHFTHIFIDEAAQMTVPEVMMALSLASNTTKVVLAGDNMQVCKVKCS